MEIQLFVYAHPEVLEPIQKLVACLRPPFCDVEVVTTIPDNFDVDDQVQGTLGFIYQMRLSPEFPHSDSVSGQLAPMLKEMTDMEHMRTYTLAEMREDFAHDTINIETVAKQFQSMLDFGLVRANVQQWRHAMKFLANFSASFESQTDERLRSHGLKAVTNVIEVFNERLAGVNLDSDQMMARHLSNIMAGL